MKDLGKYIAGFTGVVVFLYLLKIGEKDLATQLFYALLSVFSIIFGLEHGKLQSKVLEEHKEEIEKNPFKEILKRK